MDREPLYPAFGAGLLYEGGVGVPGLISLLVYSRCEGAQPVSLVAYLAILPAAAMLGAALVPYNAHEARRGAAGKPQTLEDRLLMFALNLRRLTYNIAAVLSMKP